MNIWFPFAIIRRRAVGVYPSGSPQHPARRPAAPAFVLTVLGVALAIQTASAQTALVAQPPSAAAKRGTQVIPGHVPSIVKQLQPVGSLPASTNLTLAIGLPLRNKESLTNLLQELYNPSSPLYRRYLSADGFAQVFGPSEKDYETLKAFALTNGLTITGTHPNRMLLDVSGSVATIEKTFHINLRLYAHPSEARNFFAPDTEPSVDLAVPILGISGLDNFMLPRPMDLHRPKGGGPVPYATGSGPGGYFIAKDLRAAYVPGVSFNGAGQVVGLFEFDGYYPGDISLYAQYAGLQARSAAKCVAGRV